MKTIKFGGQIEKGDFIAVAVGNSLEFGWYFREGTNTIQFYNWRSPGMQYEAYKEYLKKATPTQWELNRFSKGFTIKSMYKDFVKYTAWRVCKINPDEVFTDPVDKEIFEKSREVLIKLNIIK